MYGYVHVYANPTSPLGREWLSEIPFPTPFFPLIPPLDLDGGAAGRQSAQDGLDWLQAGLSEPKMASKMAQDSPTWLKIAHNLPPRGSKTASRRLQVVKEPPKETPERPNSFKNLRKSFFLASSLFRFRWASEASRWLQDGPRGPQEGPKRAPRRPQERPRAPQEGPKRPI